MACVRSSFALLTPLLIVGLADAQSDVRNQQPVHAPVTKSAHFAFYSDFDANLNDALITAGVARKFRNAELFRNTDSACFRNLSDTLKRNWEQAVDYYAKNISPGGFGDRKQLLVRLQVAGFNDEIDSGSARLYVDSVRDVRALAAPAYKDCHWTTQDARNRQWIADIGVLLKQHELKIATRLEQLYKMKWSDLPIPVDVVETVDWSGANTIYRNGSSGHIFISTSYVDASALEGVFHEASHLLMGRTAPVKVALDSAARAVQYQMPNDLWHVVLFFTTDEAVRQIIDPSRRAAGAVPYTPMLYDIMKRGTWNDFRSALESNWSPYVNGKATLDESARALVGALKPTKP